MKSKGRTSKLAVVLIDMQEFFLKRIEGITQKEIITNQCKIIDFCASHKIPVIVLEYEGTGRGKTIPALQKHLQKVSNVVTIRKPHNSGFRDTELANVLKKLKVKKLVLLGINASGCVQDTAMGALAHGYTIATARGVIASFSERDRNLATSKRWFSANGKFFEESAGFLKYIERYSV